MRKLSLPFLAVAVLTLAACGESEPSVGEQRQAACESFASLTPGILEMQRDIDILADPGASNREQSEALKRQLDRKAQGGRSHPYDCDLPSDQELFEEHYGKFDEE